MILDTLENCDRYSVLNERFAKSFAFLKTTDVKNFPNGVHEIEGETIFAIVQEYETKEELDCKIESHKRYIDIQYMISGSEIMGFSTLNDQKIVEVNEEKDYIFYDCKTQKIEVNEGMFTVFFPEDVHQPSIKNGTTDAVKKVVIKILIA